MASNSTTPLTNNNNSTNTDNDKSGSSMSAATYYGVIVIVVFLLIAIAIVVRIVYARKFKRHTPAIDEPPSESREREERLAMQRRGEEAGLPTYRESVLLPNNDTILAATPMSDEPSLNRPSTADTLPNPVFQTQTNSTGVLPPDESIQPPKYEVDPTFQVQNSTTLQQTTQEMRMSSHSTSTLVLPSININQPTEDPPPSGLNQIDEQPSTAPSSPSPPSRQNAQM